VTTALHMKWNMRICNYYPSAAGACPPPTVIFQGVQMNTLWTGQGNPLKAA